MPIRPPDPGSFEHLLKETRLEAASLLRLSRFPRTEPYWSRGRYRFDGPATTAPLGFGTCYAASEVAVAFCESVIHENALFRNGCFQVPADELTERHVVHLHRPARPTLVLADLTGVALKALGLNNDVSAGEDYTHTMAWARAIHAASPKWDGIRYVSRQRNDGEAVALFERSGVTKARSYKLAGRALDRLCDQFHVAAI